MIDPNILKLILDDISKSSPISHATLEDILRQHQPAESTESEFILRDFEPKWIEQVHESLLIGGNPPGIIQGGISFEDSETASADITDSQVMPPYKISTETLWQLTEGAKAFLRGRQNKANNEISEPRVLLLQAFEDLATNPRKGRPGQGRFRDDLLRIYEGRCMISGSNAIQCLEAAHIKPYAVVKRHDKANGLLLRADLHTLFDQQLISVNPDTWETYISYHLQHTEYGPFQGRKIEPFPNLRSKMRENLEIHFSRFKEMQFELSVEPPPPIRYVPR